MKQTKLIEPGSVTIELDTKPRPKNRKGHIFTIGYGGLTSYEPLESLMKQHGISLLIDIRSKPFSRWTSKGQVSWNKKNLEKHFGNRYTHMVQMGGLGFGSGEDEWKRWEKIAAEELERIKQIINTDTKVILMCAEKDPNRCHRKQFAAATFEKQGYEVIHL